MIKKDVKGTTKIYVINLKDGEVTTLDSGIWTMILHFSNAYQKDDGKLVIEAPTFDNKDFDPM